MYGRKGIRRINNYINKSRMKGKVKRKRCPCTLTEHHAMKAYWGSGGMTTRIVDLGTRWR
jgi:hypothetical protein